MAEIAIGVLARQCLDRRIPDQSVLRREVAAWPGQRNRDTVGVDASLEVDGDDEVGYGKTVKFEGSGFADGLSVNVYADPGTSSASCNDIGN